MMGNRFTRTLLWAILLIAAGCNAPSGVEGEWRKPLAGGAYEMIRFSPDGSGEIARLEEDDAGRTFVFRYERAGDDRLKISYEKAPGPLLDEGLAGYVTYEIAGDSIALSGKGVLPAVGDEEVYYRSGSSALSSAEAGREGRQQRAQRVRAQHRLERALRQIAEEARYWKRDQRYTEGAAGAEGDFSGLTWKILRQGTRFSDATVSGDTFQSRRIEAVITSRNPLIIEGTSPEDETVRGTARVSGPDEEDVQVEVAAGQ